MSMYSELMLVLPGGGAAPLVLIPVMNELVEILASEWFLECLTFQPSKLNQSGMGRNEELTVKDRLYMHLPCYQHM